MTSSSYLELLKLERVKLLKAINLYESGIDERSDYVKEHLCCSDNVSSNHHKNAMLKLAFKSDVKIECQDFRAFFTLK